MINPDYYALAMSEWDAWTPSAYGLRPCQHMLESRFVFMCNYADTHLIVAADCYPTQLLTSTHPLREIQST